MKTTFLLVHLVVFVLGAMAKSLLEPLVAPFIGPAALGPVASMAIAALIGVGLVHYLTADKLQRLSAMWAAAAPSLTMLALLLLSFIGMLYGGSVLQSTTDVDFAVRAAAGWSLMLSSVAALVSLAVTLRAIGRWQPASEAA